MPRLDAGVLPGCRRGLGRIRGSDLWSAIAGSGSQPWSAVIISRSVWFNVREERAQPGVEFFEGFCEAFHIFAMAVEHVEIHEVAENQTFRRSRDCLVSVCPCRQRCLWW